ncbi:MAG: DUF4396 domain-containing protein [Syntrophobacteraceae bacterium]
MPEWLTIVSASSLCLAGLCAIVIAADIFSGHRQKMWIMDVVWPVTALYSGPIGLLAYFRIGRLSSRKAIQEAKRQQTQPPAKTKPFWQKVALAATHCGSGCTLGDICAEWILFFLPLFIAGMTIFGDWIVDYVFAYSFGIVFQYFTIKPMRNYSVAQGLLAAIKADTLSLTAWQTGMYGWMAIATFLIFGHEVDKGAPVFWFMMQIAMLCGFMTAFPVNWWLLRKGIKEPM